MGLKIFLTLRYICSPSELGSVGKERERESEVSVGRSTDVPRTIHPSPKPIPIFPCKNFLRQTVYRVRRSWPLRFAVVRTSPRCVSRPDVTPSEILSVSPMRKKGKPDYHFEGLTSYSENHDWGGGNSGRLLLLSLCLYNSLLIRDPHLFDLLSFNTIAYKCNENSSHTHPHTRTHRHYIHKIL